MRTVFGALLFAVFAVPSAHAQAVEGDWEGTLKAGPVELRIVLHVSRDDKGGLKATMDSPDQGANGIPVTSTSLSESTLKLDVQAVMGSYEGKVNAGATAISGTWTQRGMSLPLDLARPSPAAPAKPRVAKPSDIDGEWSGELNTPAGTLQLVLHITTYEDGMTAKLDVPAQNAFGLPATSIARDAATVKFEMKQIAASFSGTMDKDLTTITGTWGQAANFLPLVLKRAKKTP